MAGGHNSWRSSWLDIKLHFQKKFENNSIRRVSHLIEILIVITFKYSRGKPWSMSSALDTDSKARDVAFLDSYSIERWECVLHYMVGSQQQEGISADAVRILLHAKLMKRDEEDGSPVITKQGFQFLLLDRHAQVWHFVLQYLDTAEERGLDLVECLTFLFQLSFSTLGKVSVTFINTNQLNN